MPCSLVISYFDWGFTAFTNAMTMFFTTVTLACQDPELLQALSRRLYPAAAVQCQCTPIAVSWGSAMLYLELGGSTHPSSASLPATRF